MCKLYCVLDVEDQNRALKFTGYATKKILENDNHGLGRVIVGDNGLLVNRWLDVKNQHGAVKLNYLEKYSKALEIKSNQSGRMSERVDAILVHGRYATCEKTLANTHPFVKDGLALIHNGVIGNHNEFTKTMSSCDSEILLHQYIEHGVKRSIKNINNALEGVAGYYACMVAHESGIVDIWRDDTANLFISHVPSVGTVIATTMEIILSASKKMKIKTREIEEMRPNTILRWERAGRVTVEPITVKKVPAYYRSVTNYEVEPKDYQSPDYRRLNSESDPWWKEQQIEEEKQLELLKTGKEPI